MSDELPRLMEGVNRALQICGSGREAALVERTCVTGSLGRGTLTDGQEATGLVLFLNIDLQFGMHEVDQARDALSTALRSELPVAGWEVELRVVDPECRGGLWAALHARSPETVERELVLQLFLAENLTASVRPLATSDATAGANTGQQELQVPPDEEKAAQQQRNLMVAAEQRARREARHQARHGAAKTAGWSVKLGCGVAEARRIFWCRQPEAALRAARGAHRVWGAALEAQGKEQPLDTSSLMWSDEVMQLLDVLSLYACRADEPVVRPPASENAGGQVIEAAPAAHYHSPVVAELFTILSTDFGSGAGTGLRISIQGGLLAQGQGTAVALTGDELVEGGAAGEPRLVVLDPCFPFLDLYEAACEAVAQEGSSAGQALLRQVAEVAVKLAGLP